ncbi:hypothetical protein DFP73DRAFT_385151 [Morchella snyderi]|nr:hypothetical protein DFP73DRAFT_385151 [Morchella snyderi]
MERYAAPVSSALVRSSQPPSPFSRLIPLFDSHNVSRPKHSTSPVPLSEHQSLYITACLSLYILSIFASARPRSTNTTHDLNYPHQQLLPTIQNNTAPENTLSPPFSKPLSPISTKCTSPPPCTPPSHPPTRTPTHPRTSPSAGASSPPSKTLPSAASPRASPALSPAPQNAQRMPTMHTTPHQRCHCAPQKGGGRGSGARRS